MSDLSALRERVAAATGADREIDSMIAAVMLPHASLPNWEGPHAAAVGTYWEHPPCRAAMLRTAERYTASLDAALALVEAKGWRPYTMDASIIGRFSWMIASVDARPLRDEDDRPYMGIEYARAFAPTPALALLAALLTALDGDTPNV